MPVLPNSSSEAVLSYSNALLCFLRQLNAHFVLFSLMQSSRPRDADTRWLNMAPASGAFFSAERLVQLRHPPILCISSFFPLNTLPSLISPWRRACHKSLLRMFCSQCGVQLQDAVRFCSNCGNQITGSSPVASNPPAYNLYAPLASPPPSQRPGLITPTGLPQPAFNALAASLFHALDQTVPVSPGPQPTPHLKY